MPSRGLKSAPCQSDDLNWSRDAPQLHRANLSMLGARCDCSLAAREYLISAGESGNSRRLMDAAAAERATRSNGVGGMDANADPWRESVLATVYSKHALHCNRTRDGRRS